MEKLTKEDIQFIDNYLLESGIEYKDIRVEMIDHVASAVEERMQNNNEVFYDAFKAFMVENKALLLKQNLIFEKLATKRFWNTYLKKLWTVQSTTYFFAIGLLMLLISKYNKSLASVEAVRGIVSLSIYIVVFYYIIRVRVFLKAKFSSLFFSIIFLYIGDFILKMLIRFVVYSEISGILTATIINFLLLNFIVTTSYFLNYYNTKYKKA